MMGLSRKIAGKNNPASPNRGPEIGLRPRDHFVHEASLHADLHYMLAGAAAENIQYGPFTSWEGNGWEPDLDTFFLLVSAHYGNLDGFISDSSFTSIRDRYWKSCQEILSRPEIRVWHQAVVKAAIRSEHGVLTGDEIDSLRSPKKPHLVESDERDDAREIADRFRCGEVVAIDLAGCERKLALFVFNLSLCLFYTWWFGPLGGDLMAAGIFLNGYMFFAYRFWNLRRVTAYHEAGQAVVARCLGVDVEILSIRPEQGGGWPGENVKTSSGRVTLCHSPGVRRALVDALVDGMVESPYREAVDRLGQPRPCPEQERQVSAALQGCIAGEVVEQIKFGRRFGGSRSDLRFFHVLAQGFYGNLRHPISGSTIATLRREHWDNCHRTLNRPEIWAWVEAVAQASLRHTVLTGDEIDGLRPAEEALDAQSMAPA
jgi:hypothetical protein